MPYSPLGTLARSIVFTSLVSSASGAIIVNGTDQGESYTLTSTVATIVVTSGSLTIGQNGNIGTSLTISGGSVLAQSGNLANISINGGSITFNGQNVNVSGGLSAGGNATVDVISASNLGNSISFNESARGIFDVNNLNGTIDVNGSANVYMVGGYTTSAQVDGNKKVIGVPDPITGSIGSRGSNINFSVDQSAGLYVGVSRDAIPAPAIPEPSSAVLVAASVGILTFKRRRKA